MLVAPAKPGEFETYLKLPRFGSEFVNDLAAGAVDAPAAIPPDYVVQSGDELLLTIWGTVDADLTLLVDRNGRITIPRVGPVQVMGTRYADLQETIARRIGTVFKNFNTSVALGRLRGQRVYVTGFAERPGAYSVNALSTIANAVMRAGGPAAAGSFRNIELRRGGVVLARFDLYDLLLRGDRSSDRLLQPDDIVHVGPVGVQAAVMGSVNREAIFELKPHERASDLLQMAGGFSAVADRTRLAIERLDERQSRRVVELVSDALDKTPVTMGDVLRAYSAVTASLSTSRQNKRVRVDGEVMRPGEYVLPPESTLRDAVAAAGGLTHLAYVYATEFSRESVRANQQANYERALRDLETDLARQANGQRVMTSDESAARAAQNANSARLIERMRAIKPTGRVVLQLANNATELPPLALEDGDRVSVPARFSTVGVFGSVFNSGSYLFTPGRTVGEYLRLAGGMTRAAEKDGAFVIRANGTVVSAQQMRSGKWWAGDDGIGSIAAEPGDTLFVPAEIDTSTLTQNMKDWTQIFYQFGLGIAGIKSLGL